MKNLAKAFAVMFVWYVICAFISMVPNPIDWPFDGRLWFVAVNVLTIVFILGVFS